MRGLLRLFVVGFSVITLMLVAAVGVSATSGSSGSAHAFNAVVGFFSVQSQAKGNDQCPPKKHHHHHTDDDKNNPCEDDSDSP